MLGEDPGSAATRDRGGCNAPNNRVGGCLHDTDSALHSDPALHEHGSQRGCREVWRGGHRHLAPYVACPSRDTTLDPNGIKRVLAQNGEARARSTGDRQCVVHDVEAGVVRYRLHLGSHSAAIACDHSERDNVVVVGQRRDRASKVIVEVGGVPFGGTQRSR